MFMREIVLNVDIAYSARALRLYEYSCSDLMTSVKRQINILDF